MNARTQALINNLIFQVCCLRKSYDTFIATSQDLDEVLSLGNDGGAQQIKNILDPTNDQDAATKKYVDDEIAAIPVVLGLINTTTGNDSTDELSIQGARIGADDNNGDTFFGINALTGSSGDGQTAVGINAGKGNSGTALVAIGVSAGEDNTGDYLLAIGSEAGHGNTGDNVTAIGYGAAGGNTYNNVNLIGVNASPTAGNQTVFGNPTNPIVIDHGIVLDSSLAPYQKWTVASVPYYIPLITTLP